jgi:NAD(P)-dependent dehydrogenase (short-subunit alcohol dehydrogenase family)
MAEGRHALVTGAGKGIGAAIARALAASGHRVTLLGRTREPLAAVAAEIGPAALPVTADVSDPAALTEAVRAAEAGFGQVDVLVNNAGIAHSAPLGKTSREDFQRLLAVNLLGPFELIRLVLPGMLARRAGRIVNVASTAGLKGYAYTAAYTATKHAVIGMTRSLALETARTGVTVNAVCPGFADTDIARDAVAGIVAKTGRTEAEAVAELAKFNPMGRLVAPSEVAAAVVFLAGDAAGAMTGVALPVAGGEI